MQSCPRESLKTQRFNFPWYRLTPRQCLPEHVRPILVYVISVQVYVTKLRPPDHYICQHSLSEGRLQYLGCTAERERGVVWPDAALHINCDGRKQPGPKSQYE